MSLWRPASASVSEPRSSIDINSLGNITDVKLSISMLERIGKIIILGKMRHAWFSINFSKRKHSPIGILSRPPVMQETGVVSSRIHGKRRKCRKKMFFFSKVFWKGEEDIPKETFFMFFDHENREFFMLQSCKTCNVSFGYFLVHKNLRHDDIQEYVILEKGLVDPKEVMMILLKGKKKHQ